MRPFPNLFFACLLAALPSATLAAEPPRSIDVKRLSKNIDDVVVPLPNEIFGALNKLDSVNWKEFVRTNKGTNFTERPRIALLLGTVIADGFIAVQAEDAPSVKEIGQRVVSLAKGIGVGNSIVPHAKAITEAADRRDWPAVRQELDRTQNSVQQAMNEVRDEKLSQLVSLGGWLRGTQVLTAVVNRHQDLNEAVVVLFRLRRYRQGVPYQLQVGGTVECRRRIGYRFSRLSRKSRHYFHPPLSYSA